MIRKSVLSLILKTPRGLATSLLVSSEESSVPHMAASPQSAVGHTTGTPGVEEIRFYGGWRAVLLIRRLSNNNPIGGWN